MAACCKGMSQWHLAVRANTSTQRKSVKAVGTWPKGWKSTVLWSELATGAWISGAKYQSARSVYILSKVADVRSTLAMFTLLYILLLHVWDCDLQTTETLLFHVCCRPVLAAEASTCGLKIWNKLPQYLWSTEIGNSLSVALRAGYLSVHTAGGASDRCWLKVHRTNILTYLLTCSVMHVGLFVIIMPFVSFYSRLIFHIIWAWVF